MKVLAFVLCCIVAGAAAQTRGCKEIRNNLAGGDCPTIPAPPCVDPCDPDVVIVENCTDFSFCCVNSTGSCVLREALDSSTPAETNTTELAASFQVLLLSSLANSGGNVAGATDGSDDNDDEDDEDDDDDDDDDGGERNLNLGGGGGAGQFPFGPPCPSFPQTCVPYLRNPQNAFKPPVDIPYCQRIACSSSNLSLENNYQQCISNPGCFFDQELASLRFRLGQAIFPGVPVCHLAIRNQAFHVRAREAQAKLGIWNTLLTPCILAEYQQEIFGYASGCHLLNLFINLGHFPKRAGWSSINERDCALIGACWIKSGVASYCAYPLDAQGQPTVRSSNSEKRNNLLSVNQFGLPSCIPLHSGLSGIEFITSYHSCLTAGCATTVNRDALIEQLLKTSSLLPHPFNITYARMICSGQVRPDNFRSIIDNLLKLSKGPIPFFQPIGQGTPDLGSNVNLAAFLGSNSGFFPNLGSLLGSGPFSSLGSFPNFGSIPGLGFCDYLNFGFNSGLGPSQPDYSQLFRNLFNNANSGNHFNQQPQGNSFFISQPGSPFLPPVPFPSIPIPPPPIPPCPYEIQQFAYLGVRLSGSFEGCCDKPMCFLPKTDLYNPHSGVSSYFAEWTGWSICSVTCGSGGQQKRTRTCVPSPDSCTGLKEQTKTCNAGIICPHWGDWSALSDCSKTCGGGKATRNRKCLGQGQCVGDHTETVSCRTGGCPVIVRGEYGSCSQSCGLGYRRRSYICTYGGFYGCPDVLPFDQEPCHHICESKTTPSPNLPVAIPICNFLTCCYEDHCPDPPCIPSGLHGTRCPYDHCLRFQCPPPPPNPFG